MRMKMGVIGFVIVAAASCGEDIKQEELAVERGSFSDQVEQESSQESKADDLVRCGVETCAPSACGYDCTYPGQCVRACASMPSRDQTHVKMNVSGSVNTTLDSSEYAFEPVLSLENVLFFGCEVWDMSNQDRDDFEISFAEVFQGAFSTQNPEDIGRRAIVDIRDYRGPGIYRANGFFSESSELKAAGDYYYGELGCTVTIRGTRERGIAGDISCEIPNASGPQMIRIQGDFACGVDAMSPQIIKL